jgi:flagellar biosynthesis/type III secretory pathway protein FliH
VPAADDPFVSLADLLRPPQPPVAAEVPERAAAAPVPLETNADAERDVRLFRARLADAFEVARETLLREFAYAVLGRELMLAPSDLATLASRIVAEHPAAQPLRLRVAPDDLAALSPHAGALPPLVADPGLAPGDALVEFAAGRVDARLGVRLAAVLDAHA